MKIKEMKITVEFEDHQQGFLRWVIIGGEVVNCQPFQADIWVGCKILFSHDILPGEKIHFRDKDTGYINYIKYPIEKVTYEAY